MKKYFKKVLDRMTGAYVLQEQLKRNRNLGIQQTLDELEKIGEDLEKFSGKGNEGIYHFTYKDYLRKLNFLELLGADLSKIKLYPSSIDVEI